MGPKARKGQAFLFTLRKLLPREAVPGYIAPCLIFVSDCSLGVEIGGCSDDDIGDRNGDEEIEERPPTSDIRLFARCWLTGGERDLRPDSPPRTYFTPAGLKRKWK